MASSSSAPPPEGLLWGAFALSHTPWLSYVLMGLIGLASAAFGVLQTTLLLMTTEAAVHGRALGQQELAIDIMPVSTLAGTSARFLPRKPGISIWPESYRSPRSAVICCFNPRVLIVYDGHATRVTPLAV